MKSKKNQYNKKFLNKLRNFIEFTERTNQSLPCIIYTLIDNGELERWDRHAHIFFLRKHPSVAIQFWNGIADRCLNFAPKTEEEQKAVNRLVNIINNAGG